MCECCFLLLVSVSFLVLARSTSARLQSATRRLRRILSAQSSLLLRVPWPPLHVGD